MQTGSASLLLLKLKKESIAPLRAIREARANQMTGSTRREPNLTPILLQLWLRLR